MSVLQTVYRYIVPAAVIQSVVIGGGYGTGREVVEYFTRHGALGGTLGVLVAGFVFFVVIGATFELARRWQCYDYQSYIKQLIGPGWVLFELAFVLLLMLVLAVVGSAGGELILSMVGVSKTASVAAMLLLVGVLTFWGRDTIVATLAIWSLLLYAVFFSYFVVAYNDGGARLAEELAQPLGGRGWLSDGLLYASYNVAVIPVLLYAIRDFRTTKESLLGAGTTALLIALPALLFHLAFSLEAGVVLDSQMPLHSSILRLSVDWLAIAYLVVLLGTLVETSLGLLQGVIERLDRAWSARREAGLSRWGRASIAVLVLSISSALSSLGIVSLIGQGYRWIAIAFFMLYVLPTIAKALWLSAGSGNKDM